MPRITCFGCGRQCDDHSEEEITHTDDCPVTVGAMYNCSCRGQYHSQDCDGKWIGSDGRSVPLSKQWKKKLKESSSG